MGFWDTIAQGEAAWGPTIVANLAMLTLAIWLMHVGLRDEQGLVFAAGVGYFLLWSVVRYVDLFAKVGGMLGAAGMFFLCGLTLFGLSVVVAPSKGASPCRMKLSVLTSARSAPGRLGSTAHRRGAAGIGRCS